MSNYIGTLELSVKIAEDVKNNPNVRHYFQGSTTYKEAVIDGEEGQTKKVVSRTRLNKNPALSRRETDDGLVIFNVDFGFGRAALMTASVILAEEVIVEEATGAEQRKTLWAYVVTENGLLAETDLTDVVAHYVEKVEDTRMYLATVLAERVDGQYERVGGKFFQIVDLIDIVTKEADRMGDPNSRFVSIMRAVSPETPDQNGTVDHHIADLHGVQRTPEKEWCIIGEPLPHGGRVIQELKPYDRLVLSMDVGEPSLTCYYVALYLGNGVFIGNERNPRFDLKKA